MTDIQAVANVLMDKAEHHVQEIINRCKPGSNNWAVRSRVSNLKKILEIQGWTIKSRKDPKDKQAIYQIVLSPKPVQQEIKIP